jgi:spermidine synthase
MFEILDARPTRLGEIALRRRSVPGAGVVHEIHLDGALLMSSLVNRAERELAVVALGELGARARRVFVGGLGLGHTAHAALDHPGVERLVVVEALAEVIDWHRRGLVPLGGRLAGDPRVDLVEGDALARLLAPDDGEAAARFDAVLVDIDHSPEHLLHPSHAPFYEVAGLVRVATRLAPAGVFALWAAGAPDAAFLARMERAFSGARVHVVEFHNPLNEADEVNSIYLGRAG